MKLQIEMGCIAYLSKHKKDRVYFSQYISEMLLFALSASLLFGCFLFSVLSSSLHALEKRSFLGSEKADEIDLALIDPIWDGHLLSSDQGGVVKATNIHLEAHSIHFLRQNGGKGYLTAKGGIYINFFGTNLVGQELEFNFATGSGILRLARTQVGMWDVGGTEIHLLADGSYDIHHAWASTYVFPGITWRGSCEQLVVRGDRKIEASAVTLKIGQQKIASFASLHTKAETLEHFPLSLSFQLGSKSARRLGLRYTRHAPTHREFYQIDRWWAGDWGAGVRLDHKKGEPDWSTSHYFMRDRHRRKKWHFVCNAKAAHSWSSNTNRISGQISRSSASHFANRLENYQYFKSHRSTYLAYRKRYANFVLNTRALIKINPHETRKQELPSLQLLPDIYTRRNWHVRHSLESANLVLSYAKNSHQKGFSAWRTLWHTDIYRHQRFDFFTATAVLGARGYRVVSASEGKSCQWLTPCWTGHLQMPLLVKLGSSIATCSLFAHHVLSPNLPGQYRNCYVFDLHESATATHEINWGIQGELTTKAQHLFNFNICFSDPLGSFGRPLPKRLFFDTTWHLSPKLECDIRGWFNRSDRKIDRVMMRLRTTISEKLAALFEYDKRNAKSWRGVGTYRDWLQKWHTESDLLRSDLSDRRQYLSSTIYWLADPDLAFKWQMRRGFGRSKGQSQNRGYSEWGLGAVAIIPGQWKMQFCYESRMGRRGLRRYTIELINNGQVPVVTKPNL